MIKVGLKFALNGIQIILIAQALVSDVAMLQRGM